MIIILILASILSFFLDEFIEGYVIIFIVFLNKAFYIQRKKNICTDNKTHSCQQLLTKHAKGTGGILERPEL